MHIANCKSLAQGSRYMLVILFLMCCFCFPTYAQNRIPVIFKAKERMAEHTSTEPERLLKQVLLQEIDKGRQFKVVDPNKITDLAHHPPYFIGASLIAFRISAQYPCKVSLSMQLRKESDGLIVFTLDKSVNVPQVAIDNSLKLHNAEFDSSNYGLEIARLARDTYKDFENESEKFQLRSALTNK